MSYREPEFLPWDGRRVPLTLVGGYLGAGKTTAINEVLANADGRVAVIINDAGAVNIDASLIKGASGGVIELTNGCVCCSSIDEMGFALDVIRARPEPPDHLIIELSGTAAPNEVVPWGSSSGFLLDGVVTVVAADQLLGDQLPAWIRQHVHTQIAAADLLVLTKTDLLTASAVAQAHDRLRQLAPETPIVDAGGHRQPGALGRFIAVGGHHHRDASGVPGPTLFDLHDTHLVALTSPMTRDALEMLVAELPARFAGRTVARAKAIVDLMGDAGPERTLVQLVGARLELTPLFLNEQQPTTDLVVITVAPIDR